jgi:hypothetical protein
VTQSAALCRSFPALFATPVKWPTLPRSDRCADYLQAVDIGTCNPDMPLIFIQDLLPEPVAL